MLFAFISQKYLRGSLIVTSNLAFAEWTEVFGDPRLTSALLDRLTHRCHILEFTGESYRFRQSLQRQTDSSVELSRS
jgi:DNA replication protein DnaC